MLSPGLPAPDFELPDQNGALVRLSDFHGSWVLLWWYPKAATPG
jgi:peroxiredoxin Q/BCP